MYEIFFKQHSNRGVLHLNISLFRQILFLSLERCDKPPFYDAAIFIEVLQLFPETVFAFYGFFYDKILSSI